MDSSLQTMIAMSPFMSYLCIVTQEIKHILKNSIWCKIIFFEWQNYSTYLH
jgi:hypothetical protein